MRTVRDHSLLLLIDIQSRLAPHVVDHQPLIQRAEALLDAAELLGVPKLLTEHCPTQIGPVIEPLRRRFPEDEVFEKTCFGAADHPRFVDRVRQSGRVTVVIAGMEAHVCVLQTALGLREHGFAVTIAADAVGSRQASQLDRELALQRMRHAGCVIAATETVLFEWARSGTDPHFKALLAIVKAI